MRNKGNYDKVARKNEKAKEEEEEEKEGEGRKGNWAVQEGGVCESVNSWHVCERLRLHT